MLLNSKGGERREGTAEVVEGRRRGKGGGALDRRERKRKKKKEKKKEKNPIVIVDGSQVSVRQLGHR